MTRNQKRLAGLTGIVTLLGLAALLLGWRHPQPAERHITIEAHKYGYTPSVIKVNKGDRVVVRFKARDVTHGFFLEGYDIDAKARPEMPAFWLRRPSRGNEFETVDEISFVAEREGKFRYRCSQTCGYMHPFMQGELIVEPNRLLPASIFFSVALSALSLLWFTQGEGK